jgi:uncharacterized protein YdeI (YjbR/CyaY-like superfamily)
MLPPMTTAADQPELAFACADEFDAWLAEHHDRSDGIWLRYAKKGSGIASVTYAEALQIALAYGWIDGQSKSIDETWYRQRWTPRRRRSVWSKRNRRFAEELIASGRMQPAGLAEVERAKADGRWDAAYDSPAKAAVPDDLQAALDANPAAAEAFAGLDKQNRYAILHRVQTARRAETRARRIATFVEMLARGERRYP